MQLEHSNFPLSTRPTSKGLHGVDRPPPVFASRCIVHHSWSWIGLSPCCVYGSLVVMRWCTYTYRDRTLLKSATAQNYSPRGSLHKHESAPRLSLMCLCYVSGAFKSQHPSAARFTLLGWIDRFYFAGPAAPLQHPSLSAVRYSSAFSYLQRSV